MAAEVESFKAEVARLSKEVERLTEENALWEKRNNDAGQLGLSLLRENEELKAALKLNEKQITQHVEENEGHREDIYSLKRKLEAKDQELVSVHEDQAILEKNEADLRHEKAVLQQNIAELKSENVSLQCRADDLTAEVAGLRTALLHAEDTARSLEEQLKEAANRSISLLEESSPDLAELAQQNTQLSMEKVDLEKQLGQLESQVSQLRQSESDLRKSLAVIRQELDEEHKTAIFTSNLLEKSKNEALALQQQIDAMKFAENAVAKKGNSLFAEVNDRRLILEKNSERLKAKVETQRKQMKILEQQNQSYKMRLNTMLVNAQSRVSSDQYLRLQREISRLNEERELQNGKLRTDLIKLERQLTETRQELVALTAERGVQLDSQAVQRAAKYCSTIVQQAQDEAERALQDARSTFMLEQSARKQVAALEDTVYRLDSELRQVKKEAAESEALVSSLRLRLDSVGGEEENQPPQQEDRAALIEKKLRQELGIPPLKEPPLKPANEPKPKTAPKPFNLREYLQEQQKKEEAEKAARQERRRARQRLVNPPNKTVTQVEGGAKLVEGGGNRKERTLSDMSLCSSDGNDTIVIATPPTCERGVSELAPQASVTAANQEEKASVEQTMLDMSLCSSVGNDIDRTVLATPPPDRRGLASGHCLQQAAVTDDAEPNATLAPDVTLDGGADVTLAPDATVDGGADVTLALNMTVDGGAHVTLAPDVTVDAGHHVTFAPDVTVKEGPSSGNVSSVSQSSGRILRKPGKPVEIVDLDDL